MQQPHAVVQYHVRRTSQNKSEICLFTISNLLITVSHCFCYNLQQHGRREITAGHVLVKSERNGTGNSGFFSPPTEKYTEQSVCVDRVSALLFCFVPDLTKLTVLMMRRRTRTHTDTHKHTLLLDSRMELCCHICSSLHFPAYRVQRLLHHWEVRGQRSPPPSPTAAPTSVMS